MSWPPVRRFFCPLMLLAATAAAAALPSTEPAPRDEPLKPIPMSPVGDPLKVDIGRRLFNETRLSANNRVSCATCHQLSAGGADSLKRSIGVGGRIGEMNTPSVFNSAYNFRQTWTGQRKTIEEQVDHVVASPNEFGSNWAEVLDKLRADPAYLRAFAASYPAGMSQSSVRDALASYTRSLTTPNSRFDRFLRGDMAAITPAEKSGYAKFKQYGCVACHQGVNVGGNMYQKFGILGDAFGGRALNRADQGRRTVTGEERDLQVFKVPGLRNVARTAPYFHDGSAATLEQAVDLMFRVQVGLVPPRPDRDDIVKFLGTLSADPVGMQ